MAFRNIQPVGQVDVAANPGTAVAVGSSDTLIAAANGNRAEITITNDHATQVLYLRLGTGAATPNTGLRLNAAGGSYTTNAYTGEIRGYATGASTTTLVCEI